MKRPLCSVAVFFIGGILLGQWLHPPLAALFAFTFIIGCGALFLRKAGIGWLALFLTLAGWTDLNWRTAILSPDDLRSLAGSEPYGAVVRGILRDTPAARIFERQGRELWHSSVVIEARQIHLDNNDWRPAFGQIIAYAPDKLSSNFFSGQRVEVTGVLCPPSGPKAEGLFNARVHYENEGIYYQLRTDSVAAWEIEPGISPRQMPLSDRFCAWARQTLALGLQSEDTALHLIWTLTLDWKAPLAETDEEPFMRAGTYHIFAVDGLRIGLLAAIGVGLLRALRMPRAVCGLLIIPLLWSYAGLTGWPPSAVRAAIMMTIVIGGWAAHRPADLVNSLFAAAFIILLWDPRQLFQPGFQLSFLVVLCIAVILPPVQKLLQSWLFKGDPFLPEALHPRWPVPLQIAAYFMIDTCAVSIAAWLGSIPLVAAYFHLFTPVSIPANILVVPLTALTLMSGIGSLLVGAWLPGLAVLFNHSSWFFMNCIMGLSQWAAHWTPGSCNVATPLPVAFVLYYLVLFSMLTGWIFRPKFKWPVAAGIFALALCWLAQRVAESRNACLHFLPLGSGSAVFADRAGPAPGFLFDCGSSLEAESVVKPFLAAHGVNTLDSLALTVGHVQATGGAIVILTNFSTRNVFLNPARDRSPAYHDVIDQVKKNAPWRMLQAGDDARGWSALHPEPAASFADADDNALVFWREINRHTVLLLSTLGRAGQDLFVATHPNLRADIVAAGLPAKDEPLSEPLLNLLRPKLIIIIDTDFPATRRASARLRERLGRCGAAVFYGHDAGALKLVLGPDDLKLEDASGGSVWRQK